MLKNSSPMIVATPPSRVSIKSCTSFLTRTFQPSGSALNLLAALASNSSYVYWG